jgi:hypothetical protein
MVGLPPQTQNANPCLKGSGPFASSIFFGASPNRAGLEADACECYEAARKKVEQLALGAYYQGNS